MSDDILNDDSLVESLSRLRNELEREIFEHQKTQKELALSKLDLDAFFDSAPVLLGIVEETSEGFRYIKTNREVAKLLKKETFEIDGKEVTAVAPPSNPHALKKWVDACAESKLIGSSIRWEFSSSRDTYERTFACYVNFIGTSSEGKDRFSFVSADITEKLELIKKKEEQALNHSYLSKMSALGEMASGIAHEIYNPLSIIKGFADLIQKKAMKGAVSSEELLQISSELQSTSRRMAEIIEGLRFFAREGSRDPMEITTVENIISATLKICTERFQTHHVSLSVHFSDKNLAVSCREVQISQVILNLLNNAFDAVKNKSEKKVTIETSLHEQMIRIRILDNGPGVAEVIQSKIFEPFFTTKPVGLGTGMGLSICKGIMETHFGSIELIPSSQGACFQLSLPQGQAESASSRS